VLQDASSLLAEDGVLAASLPNLARLPFIWRRLRHPSRYKGIGDHQLTGIHAIGRRTARAWFQASSLKIVKVADVVPPNWKRTVALSGGLAGPLFSSEYVVVGRKAGLRGNGRCSRHRRIRSHRLSTPGKGPNQVVEGTKVST